MHCDFLSHTWSITLDDTLEDFSIFLPDLSFLSAETDVLLDCLCKSERCLTLCRTMEKALLLISDEGVEDLLELSAVTVCVKCKSRESNDGLTKKTCLEPRVTCIDLSPVTVVALEHLCILHEKIEVSLDRVSLLKDVCELSLETSWVDFRH